MASTGSCFPRPSLRGDRLLIVGGVYVDVLLEVDEYPVEDSAIRALACDKKRGGNAATTAVVLAQMVSAPWTAGADLCGGVVSWMGVSPGQADPDSSFALREMENEGVDTAWREEVSGAGQPTSYITMSRRTGSRTIVSTRNGMRELSVAHFAETLEAALVGGGGGGGNGGPSLGWVHLEVRQSVEVAHMGAALRGSERGRRVALSCEVEKPYLLLAELAPLLRLCDVVILSREFVERQQEQQQALQEQEQAPPPPGADGGPTEDGAVAAHAAVLGLRALRRQVAAGGAALGGLAAADAAAPLHGALWVCPWGRGGAYAVAGGGAAVADRALHAPAVGAGVAEGGAVDSVGAGDTFIAALIFALSRGAEPAQALRCGCAVAGRKVTQRGFSGLASAVPEEVQRAGAAALNAPPRIGNA